MTQNQFDLSALVEAIRAGGDIDVLRGGAQMLYQALIEAELTERVGAQPFERSDVRTNLRNGHRDGLLSTKAGVLELKIPKLRTGRISRRSCSDADATTGPSSVSSWRPSSTGSPPARWTTS